MKGMAKFHMRVAFAIKKYLRERQNKRLLEQINWVYKDEPDYAERELAKRMKFKYRRIFKEQW